MPLGPRVNSPSPTLCSYGATRAGLTSRPFLLDLFTENPRTRHLGNSTVLHKEFRFYTIPNRVPYRLEHPKALLLIARSLRRVFKVSMQPPPRSGEDRTCLVSVVADGDNVVEGFPEIPVQGLRVLAGDVYP
jgi:hypothetical protein